MKLRELPTVINALFDADEAPALIGPSGIGKTEVAAEIAESRNMDLIDLRLIYRDTVDLRGLPVVDTDLGATRWLTPAEFLAGPRPKLFFFDELNNALPAVQAAAYQIFQERRVGDMALPDGSCVLAAMNRASDRGVWNATPMPLRRRWFELHVEADVESWSQWANVNDVAPVVIAFLRSRPELLYQDSVKGSLAPDPRAWVKLGKLLNARLDTGLFLETCKGKVGEGPAVEFVAYQRLVDALPSIDAILKDPEKAPVPKQPAQLYAVAAGLARRSAVSNIGKVLRYLSRVPAEYTALTMKDALARDKAISATGEFARWVKDNRDILGV